MSTIEARVGLNECVEDREEPLSLAPEVQLAIDIFSRRSKLRASMAQVASNLSITEEMARQKHLWREFDMLTNDVAALCIANHRR